MSAIGIIGILVLGGLIVIVFTLAICKSAKTADECIKTAILNKIRKGKR